MNSKQKNNSVGKNVFHTTQSIVPNGQTVTVVSPKTGGSKRSQRKKNMRGGMATVKWNLIPMKQPSNEVMEWATTAPKSLLGGRRRSRKSRGHKKTRKVNQYHRSRKHH